MTKRNREDNVLEESSNNFDESECKLEESNAERKNQNRPLRNTKKTTKYLDSEDDINDDNFESDFSDEFDLVEESSSDSELDLDDVETESVIKNKRNSKKKTENSSKTKSKRSPKKNDEKVTEELDSDAEKKLKPLKKKKLTAPKNLTKRNIANSASCENNIGETIYNYMKEQNRPYSVQNVVDNLHNAFTKKQVIDEMDRLTLEGKFICKEYGKQKVYLIDQSDCKELNKDEMEALDKNISTFESEFNNLEIKLKQLKQETKNITVPLPIDVLQDKIKEEKIKNKTLEEEISNKEDLLGESCEVVSIEDLKELKKDLQKKSEKLKKLKYICKSVIDTFCESMEKKREDIIEEIGIEMT